MNNNIFKLTPDEITQWVERNFDCKPRKGGTELRICNPFDGDMGYKFNINVEKGTCHDWRGDHWSKNGRNTFLNFVRLYLNCSYIQAANIVRKSTSGRYVPFQNANQHEISSRRQKEQDDTFSAFSPISNDGTSTSNIVINWVKSRGLTYDDIEQYGLNKEVTDIVFIYYEYDEKVFWQKRSVMSKRFLFPKKEEFGSGVDDWLYGFDHVEIGSYVLIVESALCAITLGAQTVASGSARLSPRQMAKLKLFDPKDGVILAFDNDSAGLSAILSSGDALLSSGFKVFYLIPPSIKYNNSESTKDWNDLLKHKVMSRSEIGSYCNKNIKKYNESSKIEIMTQLMKMRGK